mmetsp:Transcript_26853/g.48706  ORF Transcript_26853/g.48706 Transcript_26853/m.48706 type:complete len:119 (-) Transcript_26853:2507-2863(-)
MKIPFLAFITASYPRRGVDDWNSSFFHLHVVVHIIFLGDLHGHKRVVPSCEGGGPKMADKRSSMMTEELHCSHLMKTPAKFHRLVVTFGSSLASPSSLSSSSVTNAVIATLLASSSLA